MSASGEQYQIGVDWADGCLNGSVLIVGTKGVIRVRPSGKIERIPINGIPIPETVARRLLTRLHDIAFNPRMTPTEHERAMRSAADEALAAMDRGNNDSKKETRPMSEDVMERRGTKDISSVTGLIEGLTQSVEREIEEAETLYTRLCEANQRVAEGLQRVLPVEIAQEVNGVPPRVPPRGAGTNQAGPDPEKRTPMDSLVINLSCLRNTRACIGDALTALERNAELL